MEETWAIDAVVVVCRASLQITDESEAYLDDGVDESVQKWYARYLAVGATYLTMQEALGGWSGA